jgi:hypothetical protein
MSVLTIGQDLLISGRGDMTIHAIDRRGFRAVAVMDGLWVRDH